MRFGTLGAGVTLTVAALAATQLPAGGAPASAGAATACDRGVETGDGNPPPTHTADDLFVAHRIVLIGAAAPKAHEFHDHPGGSWWLKTLVIVRPGRAVTLTVPRSERGRLHLRYTGNARTATFRPCRRPDGQWSYYPGGFVYSQRGCYALDIHIERRRAIRRYISLGVGARCAS
jgi:hypothetical protein